MNVTAAFLDFEKFMGALPVSITHVDEHFRVLQQFTAEDTPLNTAAGEPFLPEHHGHFQQAISGQTTVEFEAPVTFDDHVWYEHIIAPSHEDREILVVSVDITKRRQAQLQAEREAQFLTKLLNTIDAGVLIFNFDEMQTTFANTYMERLHGKPLDQTREHHYLDQIHPDDFEEVWAYGDTVLTNLADGEIATKEYRVIDKDGEVHWLMVRDTPLSRDENGRVVENLGIAIDITKRKQLEEELEHVNRWFSALMQNASDAISISRYGRSMTYDDNYVIAINKRVEELTGYTLTELKTMQPSELLAEEIRSTVQERIQRVRNDNPGIAEGIGRRKDGTTFPFESLAVLVPGEGGDETEMITFVRDITERKQREQEIIDARLQAEAALRARDRFIANMSHELRSPLQTILGRVQLMQERPSMPPDVFEHLQQIEYSAEHLSRFIDDILDLSRLEAGFDALRPTTFSPRYLLGRLQGMLETQAKRKRLLFRVEIADAVPQQVRMDEVKFKQVLINIIDNAIKYTESGSVSVHMGLASDVVLRCLVSDTGPGIDAHAVRRLTQPFVRGEAQDGVSVGSGLGLAISQRLAKLMGGSIAINSADMGGITVTIELPFERLEEHPQLVSSQANDLRVPAGTRYTVLTVDDLPHDRQLIAAFLEKRGFDVRSAASASAALASIDDDMPDLILTDLRMPEMNGAEMVTAIRDHEERARLSRMPIIALTADTVPESRQRLLEAGCDEVLFKPYRFSELLEIIARFLKLESPGDDPPPQIGSVESGELTTESLAYLPTDWLREMHRLGIAGQHQEALAHIEHIEAAYPELAEQLAALARMFLTSHIADLISPLLES